MQQRASSPKLQIMNLALMTAPSAISFAQTRAPVCDGKKFHVQNGTSASIPGITPKTTVHVGDINVGAVADRIQVRNEAGDVLADQTLVESGARFSFSAGGHRYELNVERIEHHLTSTDFAHFCLVTLE